MSISSTSINRPVKITMFFLGIAFHGIYAFSRIGVDFLPNINLPHLLVQTTYPNANPEEVEKLVTVPLESAVGTVTGEKERRTLATCRGMELDISGMLIIILCLAPLSR